MDILEAYFMIFHRF